MQGEVSGIHSRQSGIMLGHLEMVRIAWGVGEHCSPRTIAGGIGNPFRVPKQNRGGEGIRTLGARKSATVFKTVAFDHSATPPGGLTHRQGLGFAQGPTGGFREHSP